jgi:hypothetical protein
VAEVLVARSLVWRLRIEISRLAMKTRFTSVRTSTGFPCALSYRVIEHPQFPRKNGNEILVTALRNSNRGCGEIQPASCLQLETEN